VWEAPVSSRASFPEDHPLFSGFLPAAPEALSADLSRYDFVLVLGTPVFTYHIAGEQSLDSSRICLIDPDATVRAPVATSVLATMRLGISACPAGAVDQERTRSAPIGPRLAWLRLPSRLANVHFSV
jgi:benzoylformate decarboxylase